MTFVLVGKGLVLGGWVPSKIEVIGVPGICIEREYESMISFWKCKLIGLLLSLVLSPSGLIAR